MSIDFDLTKFCLKIGWQRVVTEVRHPPKDSGSQEPYGVIRVRPEQSHLPEIEIWGSADLRSFGEIWFAGWDNAYERRQASRSWPRW